MSFIDSLMVKIALIGVLGVGAQWLAWRTGRPAIALMLLTGLIAGPVLGVINPARDFGALMEPIIKLAVAVILFDGGLSLNFRELRHAGAAVLRLMILGVPIAWALGTAAAYYGAGLSLPVSALFGGILVVTGPTVIGPMLRTLRIGKRPANILKWEGIVNDPIGALLAAFIFTYITYQGTQVDVGAIGLEVLLASLVAAAIGGALAFAVTWFFPRGYVPEYLKAPVLLVTVISGFILADFIHHETGLVTVTVMGIVMANRPMYSLTALKRFKEDLGVLLVSGVFILLPATLTWETMQAFEARFLIFLALLLFIARPVTVLVSLLFSKVPWNERLFIAWIAPRGVVAVAITGLFALRLEEFGVPDAEALIPLSFGVVVATIFAHGFTAQWLSEKLGLDKGPGRQVLIAGANAWTVELGAFLHKLGIGVTIASESKLDLRLAAKRELGTYRGDVLDEVTKDDLDLTDFQQIIAATDNDAYNALVCADFGPELGFESVAQTGADQARAPFHSRGRVLLKNATPIDELIGRVQEGWRFSRTNITEEYGFKDFEAMLAEDAELFAVHKPDDRLLLFSASEKNPTAEPGDAVISFAPDDRERVKSAKPPLPDS